MNIYRRPEISNSEALTFLEEEILRYLATSELLYEVTEWDENGEDWDYEGFFTEDKERLFSTFSSEELYIAIARLSRFGLIDLPRKQVEVRRITPEGLEKIRAQSQELIIDKNENAE